MLYRIGADLVLCVHLAFVAFAVFGGFLVCCDPGWTCRGEEKGSGVLNWTYRGKLNLADAMLPCYLTFPETGA